MADEASDLGVLGKLKSILPSGQQVLDYIPSGQEVLDYINPVTTFQNYAADVKATSQLGTGPGIARAVSPFIEAGLTAATGPLGMAFGALRQLVPYEATSPYEMEKNRFGEGVPVSSIRSAPGGKTHLGADVPGGGYIIDTKDLGKLKFGPVGHQLQYTDASGRTITAEQGEEGLSRRLTARDPGAPSPSDLPNLYANLSNAQAGHVLNLRDSGDYSKTQLAENILNAPSREAQQILVQQSMGDLAARTGTSSFLDHWIESGGKLLDQDSPASPGSGLSTSIVSELPNPYSNLSSAQAGHVLSLRDSASYTDQQRHAEITSAPPAQQTILAQQSLDQADAAAGDSPTVICTELHRQGLIPEEWYKVDQKIGQQFWHSDPEVMIGYLSWGVPVAKLMAKSKIVTFLAKGLALKWAEEMYAQECKPELSTSAGRALCKYGPRICKFIGRRMSWQDLKEQ